MPVMYRRKRRRLSCESSSRTEHRYSGVREVAGKNLNLGKSLKNNYRREVEE